ncbi:hypothetical protein DQ237_02765 [Blastococcus sp. TF02-8]|uniref:hypothetical protein n=1 Tax=Blastococcus sp. TF02-8 TaxID=2250574 RepID=UPI000DE93E2B|nr:hypothetical protein [Blastococcus sp. TF02-8]RBY97846.1 hypothetical protein DQ237_02765 [Blastococcus sp. TF02-8]
MKVWLLVYGVLYVVIEMVGQSLESVGWPRITALDVATAVTDAFLTVSVMCAVLLALKLGAERYGPRLVLRWENGRPVELAPGGPIGVRSWRPEPPSLPAVPASPPRPGSTYSVGAYGRSRRRVAPSFPEEPGHLL